MMQAQHVQKGMEVWTDEEWLRVKAVSHTPQTTQVVFEPNILRIIAITYESTAPIFVVGV